MLRLKGHDLGRVRDAEEHIEAVIPLQDPPCGSPKTCSAPDPFLGLTEPPSPSPGTHSPPTPASGFLEELTIGLWGYPGLSFLELSIFIPPQVLAVPLASGPEYSGHPWSTVAPGSWVQIIWSLDDPDKLPHLPEPPTTSHLYTVPLILAPPTLQATEERTWGRCPVNLAAPGTVIILIPLAGLLMAPLHPHPL